MISQSSKLFQSARVGDFTLKHRVVLAPLTRLRADKNHVPLDIVRVYYEQRASVPGTLLITEATLIGAKAGGMDNVPGIWSDDQISSWKRVTDAVHAKGSFIYLQLWALGRAADPEQLEKEDPSFPYISASPIQLSDKSRAPRALTIPEVHEYVQMHADAAANAVHRAGFDGVEIHGANGYLIDQFLQDVSNVREDEYGGSIENRSRFGLQVVDAVVKAVGARKTGIRFSPWSSYQDMKMKQPMPQFAHFVSQLVAKHPDMAYIHVFEPRVNGNIDLPEAPAGESNDFLREIWAPRPVISAGGYDRAKGMKAADENGDLIAYGRHFIPNPDLPKRLEQNLELTPYDRNTFYSPLSPSGYIDYSFAEEPLHPHRKNWSRMGSSERVASLRNAH